MSLHVGDIGKSIKIYVGADFSAEDTKTIKYVKPDGTTGFWTATLGSDSDGDFFKFITTVVSDIDQSSTWKVMPRIVTGSTVDIVGPEMPMIVNPRI